MHEIEIIDVLPLHECIVLVVFKDVTAGEIDAKFLRNTYVTLKPSHTKIKSHTGANLSPDAIKRLKLEICQAEYRENPGDKLVPLVVDKVRLEHFKAWCDDCHIAPERVLQAFFRFCSIENEDAIKAWVDTCHRKAMIDAILYANEHIFTQAQVEQDFDSILEIVENGISPVLIRATNGHEFLLLGYEDYWTRFALFEREGERERIESLCREYSR